MFNNTPWGMGGWGGGKSQNNFVNPFFGFSKFY